MLRAIKSFVAFISSPFENVLKLQYLLVHPPQGQKVTLFYSTTSRSKAMKIYTQPAKRDRLQNSYSIIHVSATL
jgi:hypothetical protein